MGELLDEFGLSQRRRGLREGTVERRARLLRRFLAVCEPATCTSGDIELWLDSCSLTPRSRFTYLSTLRAFFDYMVSSGRRETNPAAKIPHGKLPRLVPRPIATDDLRRALSVADPRMRCWLLLAAYQGLRCWEIAGLRREAILNSHDPRLLIVEDGKGGRQRMLPLHPKVLEALEEQGMPSHGTVFRMNGRPYLASTISAYVGRYLHGLGIPASAHSLRHWFGCTVYKNSVDLRLTQELLGHADPRTTMGYTAWSPGRAREVVETLEA